MRRVLATTLCLFACSSSDGANKGGSSGNGGSGGTAGGAGMGGGGAPASGTGGAPSGRGGAGAGSGGSSASGGATAASDAAAGGAGMGGAAGGGMAGSGGTAGAGMGGARQDGGTDAPRMTDGSLPAASGRWFVYFGGYDPQIRAYQLDTTTGALSFKSMTTGATNPSYLAFHPEKKFLYGVSENGNRIAAFTVDQATGALMKINDQGSGGSGPAHLSVHKSGKWVFSSNYGSGHIAVLAIEANGGVGAPDPIKVFPVNAHQIISDPAGAYVFVCATGPNAIAQFKFNETTGKLTPNDPATVMSGPGEPRHLAFHPNERWAYHINERTSAVVSWKYDKATGRLSDPETLPGLPAGFSGSNSGAHIVVHPGGQFVYSSNRGHNSITIWSVDAATGRLTRKGHETGMISTPRDFGVDPTGTFLIVANQGSGSAVVFRINKQEGTLTREGAPTAMPSPTFVGFLNL